MSPAASSTSTPVRPPGPPPSDSLLALARETEGHVMTIRDQVIDYLQLIDGELLPARNGEWIDSVNPASGRVWARVPAGTADDIDDAVRAARGALGPWRSLPAAARADALRAWAATVRENLDTLWRLDATDNGRARREAEPAIAGAAAQIDFHAGLAETITGDTVLVS